MKNLILNNKKYNLEFNIKKRVDTFDRSKMNNFCSSVFTT